MPLDATRRDPFEPPKPRPDDVTRRVLRDQLFQECVLELLEQALVEVGGGSPVSREQFACITAQPKFQRRLQALIDSVLSEQRRGWSA